MTVAAEKTYFIKEGYQPNLAGQTGRCQSRPTFWTDDRIEMSRHCQYDVYRFARRIVRVAGASRVVDLGCGVATKLMELVYPACRDVTGIDRDEAVEHCRRRYEGCETARFLTDDLEQPARKHGPYDLVIAADVIEHLGDPDPLLEHIHALSHDGTLVILSTPERDMLRGPDCATSTKPDHVREWNRAELSDYLFDHRFEVLIHRLCRCVSVLGDERAAQVAAAVQQRCGTIRTHQLVLCRSRREPGAHAAKRASKPM